MPAVAAGGWRAAVVAATLLLATLAPHTALGHDGAITWRTLRSARVAVHFPAGLEATASRVVALAEEALTVLRPVLPYRPPRQIELTIDDYGDDTNGYAISFPYDHLHINAAPPRPGGDLEGNGDWLRALVFHELAHLLHMGEVSGPAAWANLVLGRTYLPNSALPRFWLEGLATWIETRWVGGDIGAATGPPGAARGGRVEGAIFLARLRAALLDGAWPSLPELTGTPLAWPRGRGWYVFGAHLLDYQAQVHGADKTRAFVVAFGKLILPFAVQSLYRQVFGRSAARMWADATAAFARRSAAEAQWRARGAVPPADGAETMTAPLPLAATASAPALPPMSRLTADGEWRGRVRPHPDGASVVVARGPADGLAGIERHWPATGARAVLHRCEADCDDALVSPDGRWLLFAGSLPHRLVYRHHELQAVDLAAPGAAAPAAARRLSHGLRARELALDSAGDTLGFVRMVQGRTAICVAPWRPWLQRPWQAGRDAAPRCLAAAADVGVIVGTPAWIAGQWLWTQGQGRRRWIVSTAGPWHAGAPALRGTVALGVGGAAAAAPEWIGDLSAARAGATWRVAAVLQLGAFRDAAVLDPAAGQPAWQVATWSPTSVASAALLASGDVVAVEHRGRGMDLVVGRAVGAPDAGAGAVGGAAGASPTSALPPPAGPHAPPAPALEAAAYTPWPTLRPFRWWPTLEAGAVSPLLDPASAVVGADVGGVDALGLWSWGLTARSDLGGLAPWGVLSLSTARWRPTWGASVAALTGTAWARRAFAWTPLATTTAIARLQVDLALPGPRAAWHLSGSLRLARSWLRDDRERWRAATLPDDPFGPAPVPARLPGNGDIAASLGWQRVESYPNSNVPERVLAWALATTWIEPALGAAARALRLDLDGRLSVPLGRHRVLALRSRVGQAAILAPGTVPYMLVGVGSSDLAAAMQGVGGNDFGAVRGLIDPRGADGRLLAGQGLAWGSAELHWPLLDVGRGFDTLPLWLGRLWVAPFVDAAAVWAGPEAGRRERATAAGAAGSLGAELRLALELGYQPLGTLRLGAAQVFGAQGGAASWLRLGN